MSRSDRASPGGSTAFSERCTVRSALVKVPVFSPQAAAGRTTSASWAVSVRKMSWTTRNRLSPRQDRPDPAQLGQRDRGVGRLRPRAADRALLGVAEDLHGVRRRRRSAGWPTARRSRAGRARRRARRSPSCGTPTGRRRRRTRGCSAPSAARSSAGSRSPAGRACPAAGARCSPARPRPWPGWTGRSPGAPSTAAARRCPTSCAAARRSSTSIPQICAARSAG